MTVTTLSKINHIPFSSTWQSLVFENQALNYNHKFVLNSHVLSQICKLLLLRQSFSSENFRDLIKRQEVAECVLLEALASKHNSRFPNQLQSFLQVKMSIFSPRQSNFDTALYLYQPSYCF